MDTLSSMKVLCQVVELGSFVAAAERLDLSTAMTSKHIMNLERHLGARLLNRSSRHLSLTEAGIVYYEQCREIIDNLEVLEAAVKKTAVTARGVLKITAPIWFANPLFTRALTEYRSCYPDVFLELNLNDRIVDLVEEGFDLALRVTYKNPNPSLLTRRICPIQFMLVASPNYLRRNGHPKNLNELSKHIAVTYQYLQFADKIFFDNPSEREKIKLPFSVRSNSTNMLYQAALAGMGLAILPEWLIEGDITSRRLEVLKLDCTLPTSFLYTVYTSRKYLSPKIRTFVDFLAEYFSGLSSKD